MLLNWPKGVYKLALQNLKPKGELMSWLTQFFSSSIGQKLIMSLTGIFLILFLIVHLIGNLQLLYNDEGRAFNTYAYFMTHNPIIKLISFGLYFFIILHTIQGILLALKNRKARPVKYLQNYGKNSSWASRNMALLGLLIFAFLCIHMGDFWWKMKNKALPFVQYDGFDYEVQDLFMRVDVAFSQLWIVIFYVVGMIALYFHLNHGFQSAFQSLGINHKKYTPVIKTLGSAYSIIVPVLFAVIPIVMYLKKIL